MCVVFASKGHTDVYTDQAIKFIYVNNQKKNETKINRNILSWETELGKATLAFVNSARRRSSTPSIATLFGQAGEKSGCIVAMNVKKFASN